MRQTLLALTPWMVLAAVAAQEPVPASLRYTYFQEFSSDVFRIDDECYVALTGIQSMGWRLRSGNDEADIEAEGRSLRVPVVAIGERRCIPMSAALRQLGAIGRWEDGVYSVLGSIRHVELTERELVVSSTLVAQARCFALEQPSRFVLDIQGAVLDDGVASSLPPGLRARQYAPGTVRVVLETPNAKAMVRPTFLPSRYVTVPLPTWESPSSGSQEVILSPPPSGVNEFGGAFSDPYDPPVPPVEPPREAPRTVSLLAPTLRVTAPTSVNLIVPVSGDLATRPTASYLDPHTIEVRIPGASPGDAAFSSLSTEIVPRVEFQADSQGSARIRVSLARPLVFQLTFQNNTVVLAMSVPNAAAGRLAGKVVVVDPGHGGHDTGARHSGVQEKDLSLRISLKTAEAFRRAGVSVVMTRSDDTFVTLQERPAVATRSNAAFFISIHINSNQVANSRSGGMTFFHKQDPVCTLLAQCIQSEIARVSGIPSLGIWSDSRIYESGFAVLRRATVPAVLIELGFINHAVDRKRLMSSDFQNKVAEAIVQGVKVFLGESNGQSREE